ncbi:hypothetical protein PC128_g17795 [Phytophthora cactorum]|nr:hypothetical protein PC128_g17795 [Phytophthora cactorum]
MTHFSSFSLFFTITKYSQRGGRPRKLQHRHQVLGLVLSVYVGSMQNNALCMMFGVPFSTLVWCWKSHVNSSY